MFIVGHGFCRSGIFVIVHSAWLNPCSYSVATLIGAGLRDIDLCKGFAAMIKRKVSTFASSSKLPYTPDALLEEINEGPMKDLYNIIYLTVKGVCKVNKFGYAGTHSRTLATKIWSLAYDWPALITGTTNAKQGLMGMIIHRITGSKEVIQYLSHANRTCQYKQIILQNKAWERMVMNMDESNSTAIIRRYIPLHSGIDNNDGRQDTVTGHGTTHHTNSLFFQREINDNSNTKRIPISVKHPGTTEIPPYYMGSIKTGPNPFSKHIDDPDNSLINIRFSEDILWSLVGGVLENLLIDPEEDICGSWTAFHRLSSNVELCKSIMEYLPVIPQAPDYGVLMEYLKFLLETTEDLNIQSIYVHADEAVYSKLLQLIWKHGKFDKKNIPLMGGFHQL